MTVLWEKEGHNNITDVCLTEYVTFNRRRHTTTFDVIVHHFRSYTGRRVVIWCQFTEVRQNGTFYREDLSDCDRLNELNKAFTNNIPDNGLYSLWNQSISINQSINQPIKKIKKCRKRIRGVRWQGLGRLFTVNSVNWIGLSSVLRPRQHSIGYLGDGFYRTKDLSNSIKVLKVHIVHIQIKHTIITQ